MQFLTTLFATLTKPLWCSWQGIKQVIQLEIYKFKTKSEDNE